VSQGAEDESAIRTPDQRLRVFVSSTLGELAEERRAVSRAVSAMRLTPVLFETGARPYPPAEVYRAYLAQSDVFVGLYWQRYGQPVPGAQISGLEEEFDLSGGLPRLLYVKAPAPDREPRLADLLTRIREEAAASYRYFRTPAELGRLVRDDLAVLLSERFTGGGQATTAASAQAVPAQASPTRAETRGPRPLPVSTTSLLGRDQAIDDVAGLIQRPGVRLVTLTGPGGVGKTRLALAVGERLHDSFSAGTMFVPLDTVTDAGLALAAIGRAAGGELVRTRSPVDALAEMFGDDAWLLILDNLEQVLQVAPDLGVLLERCTGLVILATSRTVLGLRAEQEYPVQPLATGPATASADEILAWPAVALFVARASAVRPDFRLTEHNVAAVAQICRRLEGLPLAIELAAARIRLLDPAQLLDRLTASLDALGTGAVDLPERQRTLRGTVEWSVGLLEDPERSLLEVTAVFVDGWTIQAAARAADLDEDHALELSEALARHSLIYLGGSELGPRQRMLETVRAYVAERLAARPDAIEIGRRHAGYYRELAEQADRPLRGHGQSGWLERLQAEAGNLAAAVRWYLAHDPRPLPHMFRVLWLFWTGSDREPEARPWAEQLLPTAATLDPQARTELAWVAAVLAVDTGDDPGAVAARERLAPLLPGIDDPLLGAICQLAMGWTLPIVNDLEGALREVAASVEELRRLDEPVFTAIAAFAAGSLETALERSEDAARHLREARDLAQRFGGDWLSAGCEAQLGILEVRQGRLDRAEELLNQALDHSLGIHITPFVTLCLAAHAWLALAKDDPERAAVLEGAAEGLRRRIGLPPWPLLRTVEAELVAQVRQRLDTGQFDQAFAAGSALTRREAVAIAHNERDGQPPISWR
jgi:predicted ATPase